MRAPLVPAFVPRARGTALLFFFLWSGGCASIPKGEAAIDSVRVIGTSAIDPNDVTAKLATAESPKFLGILRGVANDYTIYDASVLQRDLARVERYYRGRGFFESHARVARVIRVSTDHVEVQIVVDEGKPVINGRVTIEGTRELPAATGDAVRLAVEKTVAKGKRFDEATYKDAQTAALRAMTDGGYAYATAHADAHVDLTSHTADYVFTVKPGIPAVYGRITFEGLDPDGAGPRPQEIDETSLRRVMNVREGKPYSTAEIEAATQALLDIEVFSAVHVVPKLSDPPQHVVPLTVQVEPALLRAVRLGIGAEFDEVKTDAHLLMGWEDHNLLGGLRDFSIDLKPGVVFYPTSLSAFRAPTRFFYEQRLRLQFRQPAFFEPRTTLFVRPELNVYPLLVEPNPSDTESVVNYIEPKASVGVERRFGKHLFGSAAYNFQGEVPFTYPGQKLDPQLPVILLSFPQLAAQFDFRDDPVHTHSGFLANVDFQVAGGLFGGTATDVRIQPDASAYIPITRDVTFAMSATLGLLFPIDYGSSIKQPHLDAAGKPILDNADDRDIETVYFRGFFSGGSNSNRGYPLRGVAPHGFVPFLNPSTAAQRVANGCQPPSPTLRTGGPNFGTPQCSSPIGGFTQWELSAELRFVISGPLGGAIFCDAGDVSEYVLPHPQAFRPTYLHLSCGVGGRYDTPVGPIRLDIGYRIPGLQLVGEDPSSEPTFGTPPTILGIPMAVAFGIGEAF